jgi:hypothetical protein
VTLRIIVSIMLAATPLLAQGGGGMTRPGSELPPGLGQASSLVQRFFDHLRLNGDQTDAAEEALTAAAQEAGPMVEDMLGLRRQWANAEWQGDAAGIRASFEAYGKVATAMVALEADAFAKINAVLQPNQQERAAEAFDIMAGILVPPPPPFPLFAGERGGPRVESRPRLQIFRDVLSLNGDQRDAFRDILDQGYEEAAPIREGLASARTALGAAIIEQKSQQEIDAAVDAYAAQATAMTGAEMKALATLLEPLSAEQRQQGFQNAFYLVRTIFLGDEKWDEIPPVRMY